MQNTKKPQSEVSKQTVTQMPLHQMQLLSKYSAMLHDHYTEHPDKDPGSDIAILAQELKLNGFNSEKFAELIKNVLTTVGISAKKYLDIYYKNPLFTGDATGWLDATKRPMSHMQQESERNNQL